MLGRQSSACPRCRNFRRAIRRAALAWPGFDRFGPRNLTEFWRAMTALMRLARLPPKGAGE